ncbi:hypothetical protein U27_06326 [Candidatus Vecturithrix granuli]|uniref:Uncharacterized protein n=1 Tax=Vecturithrix granuli TaxID=1499967 RepID=A0A081C437_VECG1|nr:hypothetical protein U27_06326 [Candidatus Vecturithrix granuli]
MVSNPSRDYSAFLQYINISNTDCCVAFQTLPGIIPRFYFAFILHLPRYGLLFQTLPGIIPRFYVRSSIIHISKRNCFKPFQGLFRVSTGRERAASINGICRFKPFQGLFRVSTISRCGYIDDTPRRFKPFQGLFRVSTLQGPFFKGIGRVVSNPSRDYSAFLRYRKSMRCVIFILFQTLPGIIPRFYTCSSTLSYTNLVVSNPSRDYSAFLLLLGCYGG